MFQKRYTPLIFVFVLTFFRNVDSSLIYIEKTNESIPVKTFRHVKSPKFDGTSTFLLPSFPNTTKAKDCEFNFEPPEGLSFKKMAIFVTSLGYCNLKEVKKILIKNNSFYFPIYLI